MGTVRSDGQVHGAFGAAGPGLGLKADAEFTGRWGNQWHLYVLVYLASDLDAHPDLFFSQDKTWGVLKNDHVGSGNGPLSPAAP